MRTLFDLTGRVAIVTGAGRGLGKTIALGLAEHGADVVVVSRTLAQVEKAATEISALGRKTLALQVDTSRRADVERMVDRALEGWGRIDVLVNNAGIDIIKPAVDYAEAEWDQIVDINLKGYFLCAQAVGRVMLRQGRGSILMNSSIAGAVGITGLVPYASAKGGVNQLTRTLAVEWAARGVRVNAFAPAYFENVMQGVEQIHNEDKERHIREWTPLGRRGKVEELVGPVVFLASDASSYVSGHVLMVDGGWTAA
ncbi:MAG: SDR family NAD(P)-dependent oxidoreductase [Candidatus Rokuibacteriota bacterium]